MNDYQGRDPEPQRDAWPDSADKSQTNLMNRLERERYAEFFDAADEHDVRDKPTRPADSELLGKS